MLIVLGRNDMVGMYKECVEPQDIYIIIFATQEGFTGHTGIAVDNYDIFIRDEYEGEVLVINKDTIANGTLSYFDMFGPEEIKWDDFKNNLEARFYRFPRTSAEEHLTIDYLLTKGIPHKYDRACDALIRIKSNASDDLLLIKNIDAIKKANPYFNPSYYNCTDFVISCLEGHSKIKINAKEDMVFLKANTPNRLYKELLTRPGIEVLKEPGTLINTSFFKEIILKKYLTNLNLY